MKFNWYKEKDKLLELAYKYDKIKKEIKDGNQKKDNTKK